MTDLFSYNNDSKGDQLWDKLKDLLKSIFLLKQKEKH